METDAMIVLFLSTIQLEIRRACKLLKFYCNQKENGERRVNAP